MPAKRPTLRTERPAVAVGTTNRPSALAPTRVDVQAAASWIAGAEFLMITVYVADANGTPVTGLTKARFRLWELGNRLGEHTITSAVSLDNLDHLAGHYALAIRHWGPPLAASQVAFSVQVLRNGRVAGTRLFSFTKPA